MVFFDLLHPIRYFQGRARIRRRLAQLKAL
jgi:hypothetical protein